jgi:hypothetical protein
MSCKMPECESCERAEGVYGDCPFCERCKRVERAREELGVAEAELVAAIALNEAARAK